MIVTCIHGYYQFRETKVGQISSFMRLTKIVLVQVDDYYTFPALKEMENYSIQGKPIGITPAKVTFQGKPWEVLEKNGMVYDFVTKSIVPIESILASAKISNAGDRLTSNGIVPAGSKNQDGKVVKGFSGWYIRGRANWYYSEVRYV